VPDEGLIREAARGGRAEDAVQEALVRAWRDMRSLRDPQRLDAWLRRLLVNACRDESRRGRRHESNIRLLPDHDRPTSDSSVELADRDAIGRGLRVLSADHRAVLVHQYYLGLSISEIADARGSVAQPSIGWYSSAAASRSAS
jgi:RNA polymerase sigma-70 factor (ECF subfamily)